MAYDKDVGSADRVAGEEPPLLGNTSKSDNWAAFQPVLAVMLTRTYRAVAELNVMVTVTTLTTKEVSTGLPAADASYLYWARNSLTDPAIMRLPGTINISICFSRYSGR